MASSVYFMRWMDLYATGIESIDRQHESLTTLLNCLNDSFRGGKSHDILLFRLDQFIEAAEEHFQAEEELMAERAYPGLDAHRAEHDFLAGQVADYRERFAKGEEGFTESMLDFLRDWLRDHILISDRRMSRFLRGESATA